MSNDKMARTRRRAVFPPVWASVLAVIAHPDAASAGLGAVLDAFVIAGAKVDVFCLNHGQTWTLNQAPGDLAALRGAEIASSADVLGPVRIKMADGPDGALGECCRARLANEVVCCADFCHPDGLLVMDTPAGPGRLDHATATMIAMRAAETLDLPVLGWTFSQPVADRLTDEFGGTLAHHRDEPIDLRVTVDRTRQRIAGRAVAGPALPGRAARRRLEVLAETQSLSWLRPPRGLGSRQKAAGGTSGAGKRLTP